LAEISHLTPLYERRDRFLTDNVRGMRNADFERIYEQHAGALFGFLAYRAGNRALAEDLLGDTFERVLRARRRFDPRRGSERAWLYAIALNCLRDHQRRSGAETRALERSGVGEAAASGDALLQVERRDTVQRAMELLSPEERDAVALRFGANLTVPEVAKLLGEPLQRVEGRVYRALRKLRDALEEPEDEGG
jgi:RNA polymerase sigma factor (sigma-70 family)